MLILTRRAGESIVIGDKTDLLYVGEAHVTILGIKGNQVRIGITAPKGMPVHRLEVYNRIKKERNHD